MGPEALYEDHVNTISSLVLLQGYGLGLEDLRYPLQVIDAVDRCLTEISGLLEQETIIRLADLAAYTRECGSSGNNGPAASCSAPSKAAGNQATSSSAQRGRTLAVRQQKIREREDDDEDDRDGEGGPSKRQKPCKDAVESFGCPYRMYDPATYNVRDYLICATSRFGNMTTLK